jgi:hypothetical protein
MIKGIIFFSNELEEEGNNRVLVVPKTRGPLRIEPFFPILAHHYRG